MFTKTLISSAFVAAVSAHQNFHQFWVNDVTPGYQVGIRMPPSNSPVTDVTSNDIACNVDGSTVPSGVETVDASEGDTIKVQWDSSSHPGPITHMLFGPVDDASQATGIGAGWFKIDELDYDNGTWANAIMEAANMTHEFALPTGLASGEYLLRSEMLALHGAQTVGGAQFYIGCAQLKITGSGGSCGPSISLPGAYDANDADIYIPNIYNGYDPSNYTAPGGPIATCGGSGNGSTIATATPTATSSAVIRSSTAVVSASLNDTLVSSTAVAVAISSSSVSPANTTEPITSAIVPSIPTSAASSTFITAIVPSFNTTSIPAASGTAPRPSGTGSAGATVRKYYQCGGLAWTGSTTCESGLTCTAQNDYYSQCL
ncbi:carbohydrate-binding module family 1 protein [Lophiostoma macrostomum CBS 122681]|uniref:AA9 family lytic polysaccharide monooxygenase n=1 Tax=Lophiostoma macrostomum CBS 122681 TaxID=1314788 RepID=A0A6A6SHS9_9PLEO|nr:carbohydrate-binding module family 1 protein [Lophiostoma macrostomum CBS 122681]